MTQALKDVKEVMEALIVGLEIAVESENAVIAELLVIIDKYPIDGELSSLQVRRKRQLYSSKSDLRRFEKELFAFRISANLMDQQLAKEDAV